LVEVFVMEKLKSLVLLVSVIISKSQGQETSSLWREDGRCGAKYHLPSGNPGQCDPVGNGPKKGPCCSPHGFCGNSEKHCDCATCVDYSVATAAKGVSLPQAGGGSWPKAGGASWPKAGGGSSAWPAEPVVENNYVAKGQLIDLDATMKAYRIGSGSKMVVWGHDIYGLTGPKSDKGRTKEWADFLAENGYNVLVPDWFRGDNIPGGNFFGPQTPAWSISVTNWTNIQSDWTNVILPYLQDQSPSSIGLIGTCWGSYPVVRLSMFDDISAGVSMHPSHDKLLAAAGDDEAAVLSLVKSPQLFLIEGKTFSKNFGIGETFRPGGLTERILGEKLTLVEFPDMSHGWTVRGNLAEPAVARDVKKAKDLVLDFFGKYLH